MTLEELNQLMSEVQLNRKSSPIVKENDKGYMIVGEPTIAKSNGSVFVLNNPSRLVELVGVCEYVDRFRIPMGMTEDKVLLIAQLMQERANRKIAELGEGIHVADYGFSMPGYSGKFARLLEDSNGFEIRLYMDVFKEI